MIQKLKYEEFMMFLLREIKKRLEKEMKIRQITYESSIEGKVFGIRSILLDGEEVAIRLFPSIDFEEPRPIREVGKEVSRILKELTVEKVKEGAVVFIDKYFFADYGHTRIGKVFDKWILVSYRKNLDMQKLKEEKWVLRKLYYRTENPFLSIADPKKWINVDNIYEVEGKLKRILFSKLIKQLL